MTTDRPNKARRPAADVIDDIMIYRVEAERYLVVINASNNDKDIAWLRALNDGSADLGGLRLPSCELRDLRDPSSGDDQRVDVALQGPAALPTLQDHLREQLRGMRLSAEDAAAVMVLIESLDDDGYLADPLEEICERLAADADADERDELQGRLRCALKWLQSLDPPGVGARDLAECEQMEMQFFIRPGSQDEWYSYWKETRLKWHKALGTSADKLRYHDHANLAHYAKAAVDIEFEFPFGFKELEGIHSRGDFDLSQHQDLSGK